MKPLNEVQHWKKQLDEESRQATLDTMIAEQIRILERLIENNGAYVKSPMAYNMTAGLLEQLKFHTASIFRGDEMNLNLERTLYP